MKIQKNAVMLEIFCICIVMAQFLDGENTENGT